MLTSMELAYMEMKVKGVVNYITAYAQKLMYVWQLYSILWVLI